MNSFEKYSELNPHKGINMEKVLVRHRTLDSRINYYLLESWITGDMDKWYTSNAGQLRIALERYGLTCQEWYDIAVLGFTSESQRPKCPCGKNVEFSLCFGYRTYCSKSCQARWTMTGDKSIKMHDAWRNDLLNPDIRKRFSDKQRKTQTGMKRNPDSIRKSVNTRKLNGNNRLTESAKKKISIANKRNYSNNYEAIDRILSVGYHRTKNGYYHPIKCSCPIRYLSSWELDFMKICEKSDSVKIIEKGLKFRYYNTLLSEFKIYVSDFKVTMSNGDVVVIEIKPECFIYKQVVTNKRNAAISECNKLGIKFVMLTKNELYKNDGSINLDLDILKECSNQFSNGYWRYNK